MTMTPLVAPHAACPRSWWPNKALEWPAESEVQAVSKRQYSGKMRCCPPGSSRP